MAMPNIQPVAIRLCGPNQQGDLGLAQDALRDLVGRFLELDERAGVKAREPT
jgi:hypothetical protein